MDARTKIGDTESRVPNDLLPVDLFGQRNPNPPHDGTATEGIEKAHLLPKAKRDALTWNYAAVAVLGLPMEDVRSFSTKKAILGSYKTKKLKRGRNNRTIRVIYKGIRNLLCNIVAMTCQQSHFDQHPRVFIFPALDLDAMRDWEGEGYDAIVLCEEGWDARKIGMNDIELSEAKKATRQNVVDAMSTASSVCKFLAHSVLLKPVEEVDQYQTSNDKKEAHANFRTQRQVPELHGLLNKNGFFKPICKVSFEAHGSANRRLHPAPDPMLLSFKSCNNLLRKILGFRTVAVPEPPVLDDISEE